jgi:hypothetical protein
MATEFVEESYVNDMGQKIEIGEKVLYAGTSAKSTKIGSGTFKGVRYGNITRYVYPKDENGKNIKEEITDRFGRTYARNKVITQTTREVVAVVIKSNQGKKWVWKEKSDGTREYEKSDENVFGTSVLPLKRVYKEDTPLSAMVGTWF